MHATAAAAAADASYFRICLADFELLAPNIQRFSNYFTSIQ